MHYGDKIKGRGAQIHLKNPYQAHAYNIVHEEGIDEFVPDHAKTRYTEVFPKTIINKVQSPDLPYGYSINPYQGCEHGCLYCYARNSHQYWGYDAGLDFEQQILVKKNAPDLLAKTFDRAKWKAAPVMFSGNTDCYQPAEKHFKLSRQLLQVFEQYRNPVSIITKNAGIIRDIDILQALAQKNLVHVNISITTSNEDLRQKLEPRTSAFAQKLKAIRRLSENQIPVNVLIAPVIPSLNSHEIPAIMHQAAEAGAVKCAYQLVRLNGNIGQVFENWLRKVYPDRADKVLNQIAQCHNGKINDSRFGARMRGEGPIAASIHNVFKINRQKYFQNKSLPELDTTLFRRINKGQLNLFE